MAEKIPSKENTHPLAFHVHILLKRRCFLYHVQLCFSTWVGTFILFPNIRMKRWIHKKKGKSFYNHHHNILKQTSYAGSPHHQQHINSHNFSQNRVDHHADQKEKKNMMYRQRLLMLTRQLHRMWTKQHSYMNVCMWIV